MTVLGSHRDLQEARGPGVAPSHGLRLVCQAQVFTLTSAVCVPSLSPTSHFMWLWEGKYCGQLLLRSCRAEGTAGLSP